MKYIRLICCSVLLSCLCLSGEVGAAVTVDIRPSPDGAVQYISVANVNNAAVIDFTLTYDSLALSDPVVTDGRLVIEAAAIREVNVLKPGILRVVYISGNGFKKSGDLAKVTFTKKGSLQAAAPKIESEVISSEGSQVATRTVVNVSTAIDRSAETVTGGERYSSDTLTSAREKSGLMDARGIEKRTSEFVQSSSQQSGQYTEPVNGEIAGEGGAEETKAQRVELSEETVAANSSASVTDKQSGGDDKKTDSLASETKKIATVIDSVKAYSGTRTLKGFAKLFDGSEAKAAGVEQTPRIFVADGKKSLKVMVSFSGDAGVPSFSLKGANLKGIRSVSEKSLELEIMPQINKLDVRLTIVNRKQTVEVPLMVVPPVSAAITELSDQALENLLVKADAKNKALLFDLNQDGKQDYLDDYILVGHWLIRNDRNKIPADKTSAPR